MENVFVESYRKELSQTGYPLSTPYPLPTETGYLIPTGVFVDASIYVERLSAGMPVWTGITKNGSSLTFHIGQYEAMYDLKSQEEVVEMYSLQGLFSGILVVNPQRIASLSSWKNGLHEIKRKASFCLRCLEYLPVSGVQRLRSDDGELFSGDVSILSDRGSILEVKKASAGFSSFTYLVINFTGDPTWLFNEGFADYSMPLREIAFYKVGYEEDEEDEDKQIRVMDEETKTVLRPGARKDIHLIACDTALVRPEGFRDAFRMGSQGSSVQFSLAGL